MVIKSDIRLLLHSYTVVAVILGALFALFGNIMVFWIVLSIAISWSLLWEIFGRKILNETMRIEENGVTFSKYGEIPWEQIQELTVDDEMRGGAGGGGAGGARLLIVLPLVITRIAGYTCTLEIIQKDGTRHSIESIKKSDAEEAVEWYLRAKKVISDADSAVIERAERDYRHQIEQARAAQEEIDRRQQAALQEALMSEQQTEKISDGASTPENGTGEEESAAAP